MTDMERNSHDAAALPDSEVSFISHYLAPLADDLPGTYGLRDDCATLAPLPGHQLVFKTDPVVEGVHFFADDAPDDIAWKALAVNASDLAAKAARPVAYLLALTLGGPPDAKWMSGLVSGLRSAQERFGCVLIGGDTDVRAGPLSLAVTVIGEVPTDGFVPRGGASAGDIIFVSGDLGAAELGLALRHDPEAAARWGLAEADMAHACARYLRPQPRLGLRAALRSHANAAMDISDGVVRDLNRMVSLSGAGAVVEWAELPLAGGLREIAAHDLAMAQRLAFAGGDYELIATVAPSRAQEFERSALVAGIPVSRIGRVVEGGGVVMLEATGGEMSLPAETGYDHLRPRGET